MEIVIRRGQIATVSADVIVAPIYQGEAANGVLARSFDRSYQGLVGALLRSGDFPGRFLDAAILHPARPRARRVLVIGLGKREEVTAHRLRQAAAVAARKARELGARSVAIPLPELDTLDRETALQAIAEGVVLGPHRFTRYRGAPVPAELERIQLLVTGDAHVAALKPVVQRGALWAQGVCIARDLANTPGDDLVPEQLGRVAASIARDSGARAQVLDVKAMKRLGMGAVLAVGRGSIHPPRFIVLERAPAGQARAAIRGRAAAGRKPAASRRAAAIPTVVLIGKGVTFDSGGLSLKPRDGMVNMKYDMSGAAVVLGVFSALPTLQLPFRVVGLIPSAENMPGGRAFKPGDVLQAMNGITIEVTNTDAEGRLLLADALCYAHRYAPATVIDVATLTGAIRLALGTQAAGLFTPDVSLARELEAAAEASSERLWRMPLYSEYADALKSEVADLVNSGGPDGGACVAATFLERFARGLRWAHLDIASTAWAPVERPHEPRGPTGFGVRLLLSWLAGAGAPAASRPAQHARRAAPTRAPRA